MSDIKLFRISGGHVSELSGTSAALEKSLQVLIEGNLEEFLGVTFLETEYSTGPRHRGRIDTLGLDEDGSPVIIEYKRSTNELVINQGLFYLDWLLDHRAEFEILVLNKLGQKHRERIDWTAPRLLCIAGGFTRYDEHAVQQMNRNIELIRYRRFGDDLLLFELVNAVSTGSTVDTTAETGTQSYKTIQQILGEIDGPLLDRYEHLRTFLISLGDDIQEKKLKYYVAFKRIKNFACVEIRTNKKAIVVYLKIDPDTVELEDGFIRDVRNIGHFGTGELEVTIKSADDLERAKPLIERSYENS